MLDSSSSFARCRSQSCGSNRVYETRPLVNEEQSLWTKGSAYPPAESDVLRIPFQFRLPENLPPSFHYDGIGKRASVLYSVKATGARPGLLKFDKQIAKPIAIVSGLCDSLFAAPKTFLSGHDERTGSEQRDRRMFFLFLFISPGPHGNLIR